MQAKRRKKKEGEKLEFDASKVFPPGQSKADDFNLDLEAASYAARKGEGGTRHK